MPDPMPRPGVKLSLSAEALAERNAVVKWLRDCADECPVPSVAQMFRHEANGIARGLHRVEG